MPEIEWDRLKEENKAFYARELMENPAFDGVLSAIQTSACNSALMSPGEAERENGRRLYLAIDVIRNKVTELASKGR